MDYFNELIQEALTNGFACKETIVELGEDTLQEMSDAARAAGLYFKVYRADVFSLTTRQQLGRAVYLIGFSQHPISYDDFPAGGFSSVHGKQASEYKNHQVCSPHPGLRVV